MKRTGFIILLGAFVVLLYGSAPQAFHSGGVAECSGCHSMHAPKDPAKGFLLVGSDPTSTCFTCHLHAGDTGPSSYHIATADADMPAGKAPLQRTPGGDFGWVKKDHLNYTAGCHSANGCNDFGYTHGHNVVAADFGYVADPSSATAPGGTFVSANLGCDSCHDPHGRLRRNADGSYTLPKTGTAGNPIIGSGSYNNSATPAAGQAVGAYRLLRGAGGTDPSNTATFTSIGIAVVPSTYNRTEASTQTRTAYGANGINTWGNWCATCHPNMHSSGNYVHPVDQSLGTTVANIYNSYVMSGNLSGSSTNSFTSLVPFAENTGDIPTLASHAKNDDTYLNGPGTSDKVTCLTCHRAHASGFGEALRWNMEGEFMIYQGLFPGTDNAGANYAQGRLAAEMAAAYYDRPVTTFASYQRVLCNKCHAQD